MGNILARGGIEEEVTHGVGLTISGFGIAYGQL